MKPETLEQVMERSILGAIGKPYVYEDKKKLKSLKL